MTPDISILRGGPIFDGSRLLEGHALRLKAGVVTALSPEADMPVDGYVIDLGGDILAPGYVDLQVNGGGGVMFNDTPTVEALAIIARAHRSLGTAALLPTLITDTPAHSRAAIKAVQEAIAQGVPGIAGLHLEGPHLSIARKGAHDPALIRPMTAEDEAMLLSAAPTLPVLKMTIAPENTTLHQVKRLVAGGVLLCLGHTDADFDTCVAYASAGVRGVTHLFNAMRQLGNRDPGVVGAALDVPDLSAGLIADGIHAHPASMRAAFTAMRGPGQIYLVSDAMAPAGSDITGFTLNGRPITRAEGRLTLSDGTLAGADLALSRAVQVLVQDVGVDLSQALAAATSVPAAFAGLPHGRITPGAAAPLLRISPDLSQSAPLPG